MNSREPRDLVPITSLVYPWHLASGEPPSYGQHAAGKPLVSASPSESICDLQGVRNITQNTVLSQAAEYHTAGSPARQVSPGHGASAQAAETEWNLGCHLLSAEAAYAFDMEELVASCEDGNMDWWYSAAIDPMLDFTTVPNG